MTVELCGISNRINSKHLFAVINNISVPAAVFNYTEKKNSVRPGRELILFLQKISCNKTNWALKSLLSW